MATLVEGPALAGQLVAVDAAWNLTLETPAGKQTVAAADLARWGAFSTQTKGSQIVLVGGGMLAADIDSMDKDFLSAQSDTFGQIKLPLELVAGVIVRLPLESQGRQELEERMFSGTAAKNDRLLLENSDELAGTLAGFKDAAFEFQSTATVKLPESKVAALVLNPSLAATPKFSGLTAWVGFKDGSRLLAQKLTLDGQQCRLTTTGGVELEPRPADITALQPLGGHSKYLSDLAPQSYRHVSYLSTSWPYRRDQNVLGGPLRAKNRLYLKGLGLHSAAELVYALDGARRFDTELAIDDQTAGRGSVTLRVQVDDGSGTWRTRYDSPVVRGGAAPVPVSVDVRGAKRIRLWIDFADRGDELDHADLLDARLVK